jgi:hypothetical protein
MADSYGDQRITAEDLFPGAVVHYRGATEIDLSPSFENPR